MNLCSFFRRVPLFKLAVSQFIVGGMLTFAFLIIDGAAQKSPNLEKTIEFARVNYGALVTQTNGTIKSNLKLGTGDNVREGRSTMKFIRKPKVEEDLVILELELPDLRYVMGFDGEKTWATNNGQRSELPPDLAAAFRSSYLHGYETLLRYKEQGAKIDFVETKKIASLEVDILDLTLADGTKTRYEVSRRTGHILYLEYDSPTPGTDGKPIKYRLHFKDFKVVQNTIVIPYKTIVYENGVQVEERTVVEAAFSTQMEEKAFKPDAPESKTAETKPANN